MSVLLHRYGLDASSVLLGDEKSLLIALQGDVWVVEGVKDIMWNVKQRWGHGRSVVITYKWFQWWFIRTLGEHAACSSLLLSKLDRTMPCQCNRRPTLCPPETAKPGIAGPAGSPAAEREIVRTPRRGAWMADPSSGIGAANLWLSKWDEPTTSLCTRSSVLGGIVTFAPSSYKFSLGRGCPSSIGRKGDRNGRRALSKA